MKSTKLLVLTSFLLFIYFPLYSQNCSSLSATITAQDITCNGNADGMATVVVSGGGGGAPYSYSWSENMGSQPSTPSLLLSGTYTCTIKDAIGCTLQKSITIHEPDKLTVSFITIPSTCHQSTGEIEILTSGGTGNKNYYWMHNGSKEGRIKILQAGDYSVLVRDTNGCPVLATAMLEDKDGPVISSKNISHATCFGGGNTGGGRAELNVTGGSPPYSFQWSGQESDTSVLLNARAGNYSVKITDDVGCITVDTITILQPDTFKVSVSVVHTNCGAAQGVATAVVNGGSSPYNYAWSISAINKRQISNLNSGEGTVTVTDKFGCKTSNSFEVLDKNALTVTGVVISNAICFPDSGGSAKVSVSGGKQPYSYSWYPQGGTSHIAHGLPPDDYKITVIDANGCRQRAKLKIESPEELKAYIELFGPSNDSALNGSAQAIVYGGKAPYTYKWSTGSESSKIMGMAIGDYWLRVTDQNGCVQSTFRKIPPTNNICDRNCDNSNLSLCGPFPFPNCMYPCTATVIRNIITDFGAVGDGIADDQCAFEAASYFFNNLPSYVPKVLNIPYGVYLVGRQEPNMGWFLKGQSVLCFSQISNMSILGILGPAGEKPVLKYKSCMKYGAFNNNPTFPLTRYLTCPGTPCNIIGYPNYPKVAYVGNMIRFSSCHNINVSQLELNGNIEEAIIGGGIADGIQFDYDGIYLNACYNINLDNLNIHHFGHDGIWILDDYCFPNNVIYPPYPNHSLGVISNTIIEYNGRNGLAWQGGSGLTVFNSQFNYTGQSRITEQPGAGIDIEFGHSRIANAHGFFQNCIIKYNNLHGLVCDADDQGTELWSYDYRFKNCTFIGCSTGDVLWANS